MKLTKRLRMCVKNHLKAADEKQREADSFSDEEKDLRSQVQGIADKGYRRVDSALEARQDRMICWS